MATPKSEYRRGVEDALNFPISKEAVYLGKPLKELLEDHKKRLLTKTVTKWVRVEHFVDGSIGASSHLSDCGYVPSSYLVSDVLIRAISFHPIEIEVEL